MQAQKFKTTIKCEGCVAKVKPYLDAIAGNDSWEVDTRNPEKILTIKEESSAAKADIIKAVEAAGFKAFTVD